MLDRTAKFGEKITTRRREIGLSQDALANMLGIRRGAVGHWESGRSIPSGLDQLHALASALKVSVCWLIDDEPDLSSIPPDILEAVKDERIQKIVRATAEVLKDVK